MITPNQAQNIAKILGESFIRIETWQNEAPKISKCFEMEIENKAEETWNKLGLIAKIYTREIDLNENSFFAPIHKTDCTCVIWVFNNSKVEMWQNGNKIDGFINGTWNEIEIPEEKQIKIRSFLGEP